MTTGNMFEHDDPFGWPDEDEAEVTVEPAKTRRRRPDGLAYVLGVVVATLIGIFVVLVLCWLELRQLDSTVTVRCDPPCTIDADAP